MRQRPTLADLPAPPSGKSGWPWTEEACLLPATMPDGRNWPRISIVTPSYNQGQYIEETIRSVLLQGYPNLEYIIMDGGSTDTTVNILEKYDRWLSHWQSAKDRGQSDAINSGFKLANGDILNWLCADDVLLPGALCHVAKQMAGSDWLIGAAQVFSDDGHRVEITHDCYKRYDVLFNSYILNQVSVFWKASLYSNVGGVREDLHYSMDSRLWMEFELRANPRVTRTALGSFRTHGVQKTANTAALWNEFWLAQRGLTRGRLIQHAYYRLRWHLRDMAWALGRGSGIRSGYRTISPRS
jgi:hypothetical protein